MIIGFDIDDTIADTYETSFAYVQKYILEELNRDIKVIDDGKITHSYHYAEMNNISKEEDTKFLMKYLREIFEKVKPKTLAIEYMEKLHNDKNEIILITSRWEENRDITEKWLKKHNIVYDKLIMHCESKEQAIKENDIEIFVDDNLEYCKQALNNGVKTFMMDTRPNRNLDTGKIKRVYSFPDLYDKIQKI